MEYVERTIEPSILEFIRRRERHKDVLLVEHAIAASRKAACVANLERDARLRSLIDACGSFTEFEQVLADRLKFTPGPDSLLFNRRIAGESEPRPVRITESCSTKSPPTTSGNTTSPWA